MFKRILSASFVLLALQAFASEVEVEKRACPNIHVFGARETTVPPGYGTAGVVVNLVLAAYPGSTSEAINYPACGGQASCGGVSYASSAVQGVAAVASAVNSFNQQCPDTQLVLVGYSQGGQIMDDAFCGGGDTNEGLSSTAIPISTAALNKIAAAIFMGDPRFVHGLSYEVGTCQAQGVICPSSSWIRLPQRFQNSSYCDAADPYCCNGSDANTHQGYGTEYGQAALTFIKSKLSAAGTGTTSPTGTGPTTTPPSSTPTGGTAAHWDQCGGIGFTGPTVCAAPYTCQASNPYYSQCL
ncbi:putative acetyl xylan esterase [Gymnopilus junonius]|uniref:Acetyl xylan esterase n=1 Tax=Gymnopilus junonius TaxID=109634 RepID=A0A9P5NM22_GYMJU|nr:putative acetyl xylan esterase [Gymnopilus junonius]